MSLTVTAPDRLIRLFGVVASRKLTACWLATLGVLVTLILETLEKFPTLETFTVVPFAATPPITT